MRMAAPRFSTRAQKSLPLTSLSPITLIVLTKIVELSVKTKKNGP